MTPQHRAVEARFRRLLDDQDLAQPDRIVDEPGAVGFVFDDIRTVVFVDFDDGGTPVDVRGRAA